LTPQAFRCNAFVNRSPLGDQFLECWINETEPSKVATRDVWDECLKEVRRAHIVIVLYNGDAGWAREEGDVGICHAELESFSQAATGLISFSYRDHGHRRRETNGSRASSNASWPSASLCKVKTKRQTIFEGHWSRLSRVSRVEGPHCCAATGTPLAKR
jgi:hypothetical protein